MNIEAEHSLEEMKKVLRAELSRRREEPSPAEDEMLIDVFLSKTAMFALYADSAVDRWIKERLRGARLLSDVVSIEGLDQWKLDNETGNICHASGRFFSIMGLKVRHRVQKSELEWDQPIIDQPEIGILGILAAKIHGILHFCLQAKEEPGNINSVQLSPAVQATYSNYTGAHGGSLPPLLEYFINPRPEHVLFAKLQSEDGGRFLFKSNRNMIVLIDGDMPELPERFIWLTLRQIGDLLKRDNLINACARSVLAPLI